MEMPKNRFLSIAKAIIWPSTGMDHNIITLAINEAKFLPINGAKKINSRTNAMVINEPQATIAVIV